MISIIVPIYKIEKYLNQCIDSIINQTYKNLEIILVDDGSPDNCPSICDEYAGIDSRIKVIHKQNEGLLAARKSGVEMATGDYITFVDGDDWIAPDMYEKVANSIDNYNPDMVITNFYWSFDDHDDMSPLDLDKEYYDREELESQIYPKMLFNGTYYRFGIYPNCWTKIVKADILRNNIFNSDNDVRMGEDASFTYGCLMDCNSLSIVNEPLYYYRNTSESMSNAYDKNLEQYWYKPYLSIKNRAVETNVDLSNQLPYYLLYLINFLIRNESSKNNLKSKTEIKETLVKLINNNLIDDLKTVNSSVLPKHTKFLLKILNNKSVNLLSQYIKLLGLVIK